jgi:hypothetical protein
MVSERPSVIHRELVNPRGIGSHRLHHPSEAAVSWPDGWGIYAWHGLRVPAHVITAPALITVADIQREENAEVRRVMLERYGFDRFITDTGALPVHADRFGTIYRCDLANDDPLVVVRVENNTAEPDGHRKQYVLRVDPGLRPLPPGHWPAERKRDWLDRQKAQPLTARNAVASLHGMRGEQYAPAIET